VLTRKKSSRNWFEPAFRRNQIAGMVMLFWPFGFPSSLPAKAQDESIVVEPEIPGIREKKVVVS
jgi:hypothetical protein